MSRAPKIAELAEGYEPPSITLMLGGRNVTVYKMSLASTIRAVRLAEPYIKEILAAILGSDAITEYRQGRITREQLEKEIRSMVNARIGEMLVSVPETLVKILACLMNFPEEGELADFFWDDVGPEEILACIEELDKLNDFSVLTQRMIEAFQYLLKRYRINIPGVEVVEKIEQVM